LDAKFDQKFATFKRDLDEKEVATSVPTEEAENGNESFDFL